MSDEFVGEGGGVCLNFDKVNSHGGDFGEECSAQRVGERKVNSFHGEVGTIFRSLKM